MATQREHVAATLARVVELTDRVLANKQGWNPTPEEVRLLEGVAAFTGPHLPRQA